MKNKTWKLMGLSILVGNVCALSACTAGMTTGVEEAVAPAAPIPVARLAVMPVTAEVGSEGFRNELAHTLNDVLLARFAGLTVVSPWETADRLASSSGALDYADLLEDYERTGVADTQRLSRITEAVQADYFLQVRCSYLNEDFLDPLLFSFDEFAEENRQVLVVVARMWGPEGPAPAWEAVVTTKSETGDFAWEGREIEELMLEVAEELTDRLPVKAVPLDVMGSRIR